MTTPLALHYVGSAVAMLDAKAGEPANEGIWIEAIRRGLGRKKRTGHVPRQGNPKAT